MSDEHNVDLAERIRDYGIDPYDEARDREYELLDDDGLSCAENDQRHYDDLARQQHEKGR